MNPKPPLKLEVTPEQQEKIDRLRQKSEGVKVDENWLFIAEFGYYYGWDGIEAIRGTGCKIHGDGELACKCLTMEEAATLLAGARKVWKGHLYDRAYASFIGAVSAKVKSPTTQFKKMVKDMIKQSKADQ